MAPAYWLPIPMKLLRDVSAPFTTSSLFELVFTVPDVADTSSCVSSWYGTVKLLSPSLWLPRMPMYAEFVEIAVIQPVLPTGGLPEFTNGWRPLLVVSSDRSRLPYTVTASPPICSVTPGPGFTTTGVPAPAGTGAGAAA